jgi:DNA primase
VARIPDQVIDQVRERADIVEIVGRHVTLKKSGKGYIGLCPFHTEKTPSFHVDQERQLFYCFGCSEGGDLFGFRMRVEGLDFPEAIRVTAREVGVEIRETSTPASGRTEGLVRANEVALAFFRGCLRGREGTAARSYLERRRVPADLIEQFEIGYAPPGWDGLVEALRRGDVTASLGEKAGLLAPRQTGDGHYDRFRHRIVFPIRDATRRVLGFGGRALDPDAPSTPKYLNTPESPLYHKGQVLFGLPQALDGFRKHDRAIIVEGYFDVLGLARAGITDGVAPCGTSLTADHARKLRRYVREVVLLFDGDDAGKAAAARALPILLDAEIRARAAFLPPGEDPDSLSAAGRGDLLQRHVESARPLLDHLVDQELERRPGHAWSASDAVRALYVRALRDPVEREAYVMTLASRLNLSSEAVDGSLRHHGPAPRQEEDPPAERKRRSVEDINPILRTIVGLVTGDPRLSERVTESHMRSLPSREDRQLLERVLEAAKGHGQRAIAHLLSPGESRLSPEAKEILQRIGASTVPLEGAVAEQALHDCLARLEIRALDRESREINEKIETCEDPDAMRALLEAKQEALRKRRVLVSEERST